MVLWDGSVFLTTVAVFFRLEIIHVSGPDVADDWPAMNSECWSTNEWVTFFSTL